MHRLGALEVVQVDGALAVEHDQAHVLLGAVAQGGQHMFRLGGDVEPRAHPRAQREQPDAEAVAAGLRVLREQPLVQQRAGEAMHRAFRDAEALGQFADAEILVVLGEGLQEMDRGGDRGQPRGVPARVAVHLLARGSLRVVGHAVSVVPQAGTVFQLWSPVSAAVNHGRGLPARGGGACGCGCGRGRGRGCGRGNGGGRRMRQAAGRRRGVRSGGDRGGRRRTAATSP